MSARTTSGSELPDRVRGRPADARSRLRRLAWWLDSSIRLPGGFRIGLDGIIGLIPGIGDLVAAGLSCYILAEGVRLGVATSVVVRMAFNILVEAAIGAIPVVGDLFDFVFKANERNVRLIDEYSREPRIMRTRSRWLVGLVSVGVVLALFLVVALMVAVAGLVWSAVTR